MSAVRGPAAAGLILVVFARSDQLGGAERSTIELAAEDAATSGGRWLVVARDTGSGQVASLCEELEVPYRSVSGAAEVARLVRRSKPAAVWAFGLRWSSSLRAVRCAGMLGRGAERTLLLVAQRGLDTWRRPWHNWLDRSTQGFVDAYVANSRAAADMLVERVGIEPRRVHVVHSGVSAQWLAAPRQVAELPSGVTRIIIVGNDRAEKGHDDALRILAGVRHRPWVLTIYTNAAGSFPGRLREAGIDDRTALVAGHRLTLDDYDRADVLLHASRAESFPRAVLEATARGLAVVASDAGDTAAIVPHRALFPPGDVGAGVQALEQALDTVSAGERRVAATGALKSQQSVADEVRALVGSLP